MKRTNPVRFLTVVWIAAAVTLSGGCGQSSKTPEDSAAAGGSGSEVSKGVVDEHLVGKWESLEPTGCVLIFGEDGAGSYALGENLIPMTYDTGGGKMTMTFQQDGMTPLTLRYVIEDRTLIITDSFKKDQYFQKQ